MLQEIYVTDRFLLLLDELVRFQLPARNRIRPGEAFCGRVRSSFTVAASGSGAALTPPPTGVIHSKLEIRSSIRVGARTYSEFVEDVARERAEQAPEKPRKAHKPRPAPSPKPPRPKAAPKRPRRTVEEGWASASQKLREQREARVAAVLPLVEQARARGLVLLTDICRYLDDIGHAPPQGERWSRVTLHKMLPNRLEEMRRAIDAAIDQAQVEGLKTSPAIASWLNRHGHRTARDKDWTSDNVFRLLKARKAAT